MTEILTPADQFNLTLLHNIEDKFSRISVMTYGPDEEEMSNGISCPFKVGKLYQNLTDLYLIQLINKPSNDLAAVAEDVCVPANSILIFMGIERFYFEKVINEDSFSVYSLKFLYEDSIYYDLIPTRFNYDGFDWTEATQQNVQMIIKKVLIDKLLLLQNA